MDMIQSVTHTCKSFTRDLSVTALLRGDIFRVRDYGRRGETSGTRRQMFPLSFRPNTTNLVISTKTLRNSAVLPGEISY